VSTTSITALDSTATEMTQRCREIVGAVPDIAAPDEIARGGDVDVEGEAVVLWRSSGSGHHLGLAGKLDAHG
jgi:hypothetical protein